MIDWVKAKVPILAIVNGVLMLLALTGKIGESAIGKYTDVVSNILDAIIVASGSLAVFLPAIFKKKESK